MTSQETTSNVKVAIKMSIKGLFTLIESECEGGIFLLPLNMTTVFLWRAGLIVTPFDFSFACAVLQWIGLKTVSNETITSAKPMSQTAIF